MIIKNILHKNKILLEKHNIDNFHIDAEILLCFVLLKEREFLISHTDDKISLLNRIQYSRLIKKRIAGFSVAAIIGQKSFYGKEFIINNHVLVPRPETEIMVDEVIKQTTIKKENVTFVDVGTGTGCIPITIAKHLVNLAPNSNNLYFAIDISKKALKIARKNSILHNTDKIISFLHGDLLSPVLKTINTLKLSNNQIIITANLPYLTKKQIDNSPSIKREPILALDGGDKGLEFYKRLFTQAQELLRIFETPLSIYCEIDPSQSREITDLQRKHLPKFKTSIKKDLSGLDRIAIITN